MKICIDPGHRNSVYDFGAVSNNVKESEIALKIALLVGEGFEKAGHEVFYTRKKESDVIGLDKRIKNANAIKGLDYYLSIHINSFNSESANGFEVWHYGKLDGLASSICKAACEATGFTNRGPKTSTQYAVLKNTNCNALIIENGFVSNTQNRALLIKSDVQLKLANAILSAFNVKPLLCKNDAAATIPKQHILLNDALKEVEFIVKDGFTYVKLRDLADAKIKVDYDSVNKLPIIKVK